MSPHTALCTKFDTCNLADHNEDLNLHNSANDRDNVPDYSDNTGVERKIDRDTALRKLMGTNNVYNPDRISTPARATEPTSLAAFIGGRATTQPSRASARRPRSDAVCATRYELSTSDIWQRRHRDARDGG